jgi:hypothetical protein
MHTYMNIEIFYVHVISMCLFIHVSAASETVEEEAERVQAGKAMDLRKLGKTSMVVLNHTRNHTRHFLYIFKLL